MRRLPLSILLLACNPGAAARTEVGGGAPIPSSAAPTAPEEASPVVPSEPETAAPTPPPEDPAAADPFEQPPRGASANCGPDQRGRWPGVVESAVNLATLLTAHGSELSPWIQLGAFSTPDGQVDAARVAAAVQRSSLGERTLYTLRFRPPECAEFTLRMTHDGFWSLYGCCGK